MMQAALARPVFRSRTLVHTLRAVWVMWTVFVAVFFILGGIYQWRALSRGILGMSMRREGSTFVITEVAKDSPASRVRLNEGDRLLGINRKPFDPRVPSLASQMSVEPTEEIILDLVTERGVYRRVILTPEAPGTLPYGMTLRSYASFMTGLDGLFLLVNVLAALLIMVRAPRDWFPILVAFALVGMGTRIPAVYSYLAARYPDLSWVWSLINMVGYLSGSLVLAFFPNGRLFPKAAWAFIGLSVFHIINVHFTDLYTNLQNDLLFTALDMGVLGMGVVFQVIRYHRVSNAVERQQSKWVVFAIAVAFLGYYIHRSLEIAVTENYPPFSAVAYQYDVIGHPIYYLALLFLPVGVTISVLRYRLWDIDLIIRRTLVYSFLSVLLLGVYFAAVTVIQQVFVLITGQTSSLAVVISTLASIALATPLRGRVQRFIDRRFYRSKYNAEQLLAAFGTVSRDEVDLEVLSRELLGVADQTVRPRSASLWIKKV